MRRAIVLLVLSLLVASAMPTAAAQPSPDDVHRPPVDAEILDPFRPPPEPWMAGNRGIEYATVDGDIIHASADGVVVFAGPVAGAVHVTVRHGPDLVTTAAFVREVLVTTGDVVVAGTPIAIAAGPFHFTARRNGRYVDPEALFGTVRLAVRLVPTW